jgi:hypothetical protein
MFNKITLSQKCILFSILLIKTTAYCADEPEYNSLYLDARIRWLEQEGRINQLKNAARESSAHKFSYYVITACYVIGKGHIAQFDAEREEITTFVPKNGQTLTLSYKMFDNFIEDERLLSQARKRHLEPVKTSKAPKNNTAKRCNCSIV